jgi:hypothetical protein
MLRSWTRLTPPRYPITWTRRLRQLDSSPEPAKVLKDETIQERLKDLHMELSAHAP